MKVLFDARYLNNPSSGISVYCDNLLKALLAADSNLELVLVTRKPGLARQYDSERCTELRFAPPPRSFSTLFALSPMLGTGKFELFHSPFNIIPSGLKCRSVVTIHDIMQLQDPANITVSGFVQNTAGLFWRARIRHAAANATVVAAVSDATRTALLEHFPKLAPEQVIVTPNGVDQYFFQEPTSSAVSQVRELVGAERFVLCVGNESPHKNHARAIRAFFQAFPDDSSIRFVLVRRSVRRDPEMLQLLKDAKIAQRLLVLQHVDQALLRALYSQAHLFFFPSWVEGFGIPILESMAAGTVVITGDRSAPAEVAGQAAALVDPFDVEAMAARLKQLDGDSGERQTLIERGRSRAAQYTWQRCAEQTLLAYRAAMARPETIS